jgi:hypothetical protein
VIEISEDGSVWVEIDRRMDNDELSGANVTKSFAVQSMEEGRFLRLRLIGKNNGGADGLQISSFEVFGNLFEEVTTNVSGREPRKPGRSGAPVLRSEVILSFKGSQLDGIIAYLTKKFGGNVEEKGAVRVFGKPLTNASRDAPHNIADLNVNSVFCSVNEAGQVVGYDFMRYKVRPTHYSIRSFYGDGELDLRSWVLEISRDGRIWTEVDRRVRTFELNSRDVTKTFEIGNSPECRFVRIRQIDQNHAGTDSLCISSFELFGSLIDDMTSD